MPVDPKAIMDQALTYTPGEGTEVLFPSEWERERFRWRCYSAMSAEARRSRRELDPRSAGWGKHPWSDIKIIRQGEWGLWIGRRLDTEAVVTEGVPQAEAQEEEEQVDV